MSSPLKAGAKVRWRTSQGMTTGRVERKLTAPCEIKGHHVAASPEEPQFLVRSDGSGALAAHRPESLEPAHGGQR